MIVSLYEVSISNHTHIQHTQKTSYNSWWLDMSSDVIFKRDISVYSFLAKSLRSPGYFVLAWWNGIIGNTEPATTEPESVTT